MVFAASSTSLLLLANQTATAAPQSGCQTQDILTSALSSPNLENYRDLSCKTTTESLINSETTPEIFECATSKNKHNQQSTTIPNRIADRKNAPKVTNVEPASELIEFNPSNLSPIAAVERMLQEAAPESPLTTLQLPVTSISIQSASGCTSSKVINPRPKSNPLSTDRPLIAQRSDQPASDPSDGELGELRLRELSGGQSPNGDSELGRLRIREIKNERSQQAADPELGRLRIRELDRLPTLPNIVIPPPSSPQLGALLAQIGYFQTNNVFSGVDPIQGGLLSTGVTLITTPQLGPDTDLIAAIDGSLIRYIEQSESNYNQFRLRAGIRQQLSPRMYGEIGLINQQLFRADAGDRFLSENALRLVLRRRDRLTDKLRLDSFYELRISDADPQTRSRIINSLAVSLSYNLQNNLSVGLDYQYALSDFTQRDREDEYHRLLGRLTYAVSRSSQINLQSGVTLGGSSDPNIDFDNFFLSVTYTVELGSF